MSRSTVVTQVARRQSGCLVNNSSGDNYSSYIDLRETPLYIYFPLPCILPLPPTSHPGPYSPFTHRMLGQVVLTLLTHFILSLYLSLSLLLFLSLSLSERTSILIFAGFMGISLDNVA